jgi:hypothetical protein
MRRLMLVAWIARLSVGKGPGKRKRLHGMGWAKLGKMSDDSVTLIPFDDRAAWERAAANALPAQNWGHAAGLAAEGMAPELAVVRAQGATMILPFHKRQFRGQIDITTLPGLSGALIRPDSTAPLQLWRFYARSRGWVAGYLQLSADNAALLPDAPDMRVSKNEYFLFDLNEWQIERSIGHNMRKSLRRAQRDGAVLVTDQARLWAAFPGLHAQSMQMVGAQPAYGPAVLDAWAGSSSVHLFGGEVAGELQIAVLCVVGGDRAEGYLTGASPKGRSLHAWIFWQAAEWFSREGLREFNIGGYGVHGDGLHQMKARLVSRAVPLASVLQVYDQARYDQLCAQTGADPASSYFPQYRDPALLAVDHLSGGADQA